MEIKGSQPRFLFNILSFTAELEPHRELYSVVAKWEHKLNDKSVEVDSDFVFLSFAQYFYKEKNGLSGATMVKVKYLYVSPLSHKSTKD